VEEVEHLHLTEPCEPRKLFLPARDDWSPGAGSRVGQAEQAEGGGDWRCGQTGDSDRARDAERAVY